MANPPYARESGIGTFRFTVAIHIAAGPSSSIGHKRGVLVTRIIRPAGLKIDLP
jgi:hypothetical protein